MEISEALAELSPFNMDSTQFEIRSATVNDERRVAVFSKCLTYRYILGIYWNYKGANQMVATGNKVQFVGLNPSTATHYKDDPTLRRCKSFARTWGYNGLIMTNLFAFRATDPKDMMAAENPEGEDMVNDQILESVHENCYYTVAAWGTHGKFRERAIRVKMLFKHGAGCLKKTKDGYPSHPLYLKKDVFPQHYWEHLV